MVSPLLMGIKISSTMDSTIFSSYIVLTTTISIVSKGKLIVLIENNNSLTNIKSSSSFVMPF
jgi:hypothetical protein